MSMFDYRMIIEGQSNNNEAGKRGWLFGAGVAAVFFLCGAVFGTGGWPYWLDTLVASLFFHIFMF